MDCDFCKKPAYLGFTCKRCGMYFCSKHRLPEAHDCALKDMNNNEVALKIQLERANNQGSKQTPYPATRARRPMYADDIAPKQFDDDDSEDEEYNRPRVRVDLTTSLLVFVLFAAIDFIWFVSNPFFIFNLLPLIVHGAYLPVLFYIAQKQKRGELPPKFIFTYIQIIISYIVAFISVKIVAALLSFNPTTIMIVFFFIFIGGFMIYQYKRLENQLRFVL